MTPATPAISRNLSAVDNHETTLSLVSELCRALADRKIPYCHWKSNDVIERSANGENDLDLLVSRRHSMQFTEVLSELDFKEAQVRPAKRVPGISHWYGFDEPSGKLVHVDSHYQLMVGDDMTKNYRLPIEDAYIASAAQGPVFAVPAAEFEYLVFVIRMVLKHFAVDAVLSGLGRLRAAERRELDYLVARVDARQVDELLQRYLPLIDGALWGDCVASLEPSSSLSFRVRTGLGLQRRLTVLGRRSVAQDTVFKVQRRISLGTSKFLLRRPSRKLLTTGGALIALVGGDGSGKSTAVDGLEAWLSPVFATRRVHLGKPPRSPARLAVNAGVEIGRRAGLLSRSPASTHQVTGDSSGSARNLALLTWHALMAKDRRRAYLEARRFTGRGGLVVSDRFPLPQISLMDGGRTAKMVDQFREGTLARYLADFERRHYARMLLPDVLIVLRVDPEIAVARKVEEDPDFVRARSSEVWQADWSDSPAEVIDAGQPKEMVLRDIKRHVWARL